MIPWLHNNIHIEETRGRKAKSRRHRNILESRSQENHDKFGKNDFNN